MCYQGDKSVFLLCEVPVELGPWGIQPVESSRLGICQGCRLSLLWTSFLDPLLHSLRGFLTPFSTMPGKVLVLLTFHTGFGTSIWDDLGMILGELMELLELPGTAVPGRVGASQAVPCSSQA